MTGILSLVTFLPFAGVAAILTLRFFGQPGERTDTAGKWITLATTLATFALSVKLVLVVLLTAFLLPLCILASWKTIETRVLEYMVAFLILESLVIGVFCALDLIVFYLFFEAGLVPMFLIIGIWGGKNRVYAAFKFFLYTLLGSVLMLAAILVMIGITGTSSIPGLMTYD